MLPRPRVYATDQPYYATTVIVQVDPAAHYLYLVTPMAILASLERPGRAADT